MGENYRFHLPASYNQQLHHRPRDRGEPGPGRPRRAHRPDGRARHRLRLRRPDDQFSDPARRQRSPARRGAGRDPRRAVGRVAVHRDRAGRAGPAVRRRRADRARDEHHEHGPGGHVHRLRRRIRAAPVRRTLPHRPARHVLRRRTHQHRGRVTGLRARVRDRRRRRRRSGHGVLADGRVARARRHRRGDHHGRHSRRRRGRPPRPRVPAAGHPPRSHPAHPRRGHL